MLRVVTFIDSQNIYKGAREQFFPRSAFHTCGQIKPMGLGKLLAERDSPGQKANQRTCESVRVYTGRPSTKDSKSYGAHMRQCQDWEAAGVTVIPRSLRYPDDWPISKPYEKGIDVALAVDLVAMAIDQAYDVGVVASADTDLAPAVEYVLNKTAARVELAAWCADGTSWNSPVKGVWCHRLAKDAFDAVAEYRDYNIK